MREMATFRENFSSGMNYLRRRFSSDDILRDSETTHAATTAAPPPAAGARGGAIGRKLHSLQSAPSFPSLSSVHGMTRGLLSQAAAAATSAAANVTSAVGPQRIVFNKEHCKVLLIIDDKHNDW